jgi:hypothetical protein
MFLLSVGHPSPGFSAAKEFCFRKCLGRGAHRLDRGGYIFGLCPDLYVNLGSFKLSSVLVFLVLCFFSLDSLLFVYMN